MLSRVAERTYWLARYLERAENLARICNVFGKLFLDLPQSAGIGWLQILSIVGVSEATKDDDACTSSSAAIDLLVFRQDEQSSLYSSVMMARENARTSRDVLPTEAWLVINKLYLLVRNESVASGFDGNLHQYLAAVVEACHQLNGLLAGTMSHGVPHRLMVVGRHLERADMTTRTIDAAASMLMTEREELLPLQSSLWAAVLRSVSGYQMYRQYVRRRILADDVIGFLMANAEFPRSITYCVDRLVRSSTQLPRHGPILDSILPLQERLAGVQSAQLTSAELHELIDTLQSDIGLVHQAITDNWFDVWKHK